MRNTPHAIGEMHQKLDLQISRLPQAREVRPEDRRRWVEAVLDLTEGDYETASYLVHRRSGFFPADTAALLAEQWGKPLARTSHDVVMEKLFRTLPQATSIDALRTLRAEPVIRNLFLSKVEGFTRNIEAIDDVSTFCHPDHPWMMDAPQDILNLSGHVVLADYRASDGDLARQYREKGLPPEFQSRMLQRMVLSFAAGYPPARALTVVFDPSRWDVDAYAVDYDRHQAAELVAAGDRFWNDFVMKGCVPPAPEVKIVDPAKLPASMMETMGDVARLKVVEQAVSADLSEKTELLKSQIKAAGNLGKASLTDLNGLLTISAKPDPDLTAMQERLTALKGAAAVDACKGVSAPDFMAGYQLLEKAVSDARQMKVTTAAFREMSAFIKGLGALELPKLSAPIDGEKLAEALTMAGDEPSRYIGETYRIGLTRKEAGLSAELLSAMKDKAVLALGQALAQLGPDQSVPPPTSMTAEISPKRSLKKG